MNGSDGVGVQTQKPTAWAELRQLLDKDEASLTKAVDSVRTEGLKMRVWAQGLLAKPSLMRREIRRNRLATREQLEGDDASARLFAEWACSAQYYRDIADPDSSFDVRYEDEYGGGRCVFFPLCGPRETQEEICDVVRQFRRKARTVFSSRADLRAARRGGYAKINWDDPPENWADRWDEDEWLAHLYETGMESLECAHDALFRTPDWPRVVHYLKAAMDSLRAMDFAGARDPPTVEVAQKIVADVMNDKKHSNHRKASARIPVLWQEQRALGESKNEAAKHIAKEVNLAYETVRRKLQGL